MVLRPTGHTGVFSDPKIGQTPPVIRRLTVVTQQTFPSHFGSRMSPNRQRRFLVIDVNSDSRFLLVKTLLRKFPHSVIQECQEADSAVAFAGTAPLDAIVTHRSLDVDGIALVRLLRAANATVPIVMVSGSDRSREALDAGANRFLSYDEWLRIGTVVLETLGSSAGQPEPSSGSSSSPPPSQTTPA